MNIRLFIGIILCSAIGLTACQQQRNHSPQIATQPHHPDTTPRHRLPPPAPPHALAQACQDKTIAQATTLTVASGQPIAGRCQLMFVPDQPVAHPAH
jgi:hypothetical protein